MFKEVLQLIRGEEPYQDLGDGLDGMLQHAASMAQDGLAAYWRAIPPDSAMKTLADADVGLNQRERELRKKLVMALALDDAYSETPLLTLMSLAKDVERIGDYAKGLAELGSLADVERQDELTKELRGLSDELGATLAELPSVLRNSDRERAMRLTSSGRPRARRFKELINEVAQGNYSSDVTTALALGVHYHRRLQGHALNLLSSLLMPVHKLDYFDEESLSPSNRSPELLKTDA